MDATFPQKAAEVAKVVFQPSPLLLKRFRWTECSYKKKTRPIAISCMLRAFSDGPTERPTDRPTDRPTFGIIEAPVPEL